MPLDAANRRAPVTRLGLADEAASMDRRSVEDVRDLLATAFPLEWRDEAQYSKDVRTHYAGNEMRALAKITAKGQTTIPQVVRAALHVVPGDLIAWEVGADGTATVCRVQPMDIEYLRALEGTLGEWASAADEEAYGEL